MPIYEYECNACGDRHEFIQKFSDGPKRKCPSCGKSRLKKLMSAAAFHLKGTGWYVTDFRDKDGKGGKKDESSSDSTAEAKADGADSKGDAKSDAKSDSGGDGKSESKTDKKASKKKSASKKTKAA